MYSSLALACLALANLCQADPGFVALKTYRDNERHSHALQKRGSDHITKRDAFPVTLNNYPFQGGGFYFVNATVGSPAQFVQLDIDTGSSDVWMFGPHSCDDSNGANLCQGYSFDTTASETVTIVAEGQFKITYVTVGSGVNGDFIADDFRIGQQTIKNLTMGVARSAVHVDTGIMGIGLDSGESSYSVQIAKGNNVQPYPNLIDEMKRQGLIGVKSYSLYLDSLQITTGSIIFGGYDTTKYQGDLGILQIQPDSQAGTYSSFGVVLDAMGVTDSKGSLVLSASALPEVVILDSGTALTYIPSDIFSQLLPYFGVIEDDSGGWLVRCDMSGMTGTLDYRFGGPNGPIISVPFLELAVPFVDPDTGYPVWTDSENNPLCIFGIDQNDSPDTPFLFGDTFLRSAYVVYDLENYQVGIAQTIFNVAESNIQVITVGEGQNLPGEIAGVQTTILQTKTQVAGQNYVANTATGHFTAKAGEATGVLSGVMTTYTDRATGVPGASASATTTAKHSGADSLKAVTGRGVLVQGLIVIMASAIGARLIL